MGDCLSKSELIFELSGFRKRSKKCSTFQSGSMAEIRANAMGLQVKKWKRILTPVKDRFSPQACELEIDSFNGVVCHKKSGLYNPGLIKL